MPWTVVIPVRAPGKTRLGRGPDFARAIALDTIEAAVLSGAVVVVVTADTEIMDAAAGLGASVVVEQAPSGIADAIALALPSDGPRAVLLGDLPALRPADLAAALAAALNHEHAFVVDADGTGSTLVTAGSGVPFLHHFGEGSAWRHRAADFVELPAADSLRRDVDLPEHLDHLHDRLGPRTSAALAAGPH